MAIKSWIDEIKNSESGPKSEAQLDQPGEKEADKILFAARDRIIEGGVFHFTPETAAAEMDIDRTFKAIITGGHDFAALSAACAYWIEAARKVPAQPETISLFSGSSE